MCSSDLTKNRILPGPNCSYPFRPIRPLTRRPITWDWKPLWCRPEKKPWPLILKPWAGPPRPQLGIGGSPFFRGFVSGLGLLHLAAAFADLRSLARVISDEPSPAPATQEPAP